MRYTIYHQKKAQNLIHVKLEVQSEGEETVLWLPRWRPGRYILTDFVQYIRDIQIKDGNGNELSFQKNGISSWVVNTKSVSEIEVNYAFYVNLYDAGSSWITDEMLYVNPVNLLMYTESSMNNNVSLKLDHDPEMQEAINLPIENGVYVAKDFHELVDTPFIVSYGLIRHEFEVEGVHFRLFFEGNVNLDLAKIETDIVNYTKVQFEAMGSFPVDKYDYYFLIPPYDKYHGVEHQNSTVVAIGPDYKVMDPEVYNELMGVSSHELFHTWNVKLIRPIEMTPYDYQKENFNKLGYVTEGVTTYYGDLFLKRSGFFDVKGYFKELETTFKKHFENEGRFHKCVADASYDTWIDGYKVGIPHSKTNIYTEGSLTALMTDLSIRLNTNHEKSLDDVMVKLYNDFGKKGKGYSEEDYQRVVNELGGDLTQSIFENHIYGVKDFEPALTHLLSQFGVEMYAQPNSDLMIRNFGIQSNKTQKTLIDKLVPNSNAAKAGLLQDDVILSINGYQCANSNIQDLADQDEVEIIVNRQSQIHAFVVPKFKKGYYPERKLRMKNSISKTEESNLKSWFKLV